MLTELLHPERVRIGLTISDKEAALRTVAALLCMPEGIANEEVIYDVLLLAALAGVSRVLRNDQKRQALLKAADDAEAYRTLVEP